MKREKEKKIVGWLLIAIVHKPTKHAVLEPRSKEKCPRVSLKPRNAKDRRIICVASVHTHFHF